MSSKFPRPAIPQDVSDAVKAQALAEARVRWGLDVAPPATVTIRPEERSREDRKRVDKMVRAAGTPLHVEEAVFAHSIPAEWTREVEHMSPPSDQHSYLKLMWREPLFRPEQRRLCLIECTPDALIHPEYRMMLQEKPYWELPKAERPGRSRLVTAFQWMMYRKFRVKATPFWCLQGKDGGTPISYSDIERRWLRAVKQPDSPPMIGELEYAPWDNRVRAAVERRDRLAKFGGSIDRLRQRGNAAYLKAETDEAERQYRKEFFRWFSDTMQEQADVWRWYTGHTEVTHRIPQQTRAEWLASLDAEERFIETGRVGDAIEYAGR